MIRNDLAKVWQTIQGMKGDAKNTKFNYVLIKNRTKVKDEIIAINSMNRTVPEFKAYDDERVELCKKYAIKKEDGSFDIEGNQFKFTEEDRKLLTAEMEELHVKHNETLKAHDEAGKKFQDFMNETITIDFHKVALDELPTDLDLAQVEALEFMIKE